MSARANYFKIGLFVISGSALLIAGVIALGAGALFEKKIRMETYVDESVQGLDVGSPVKYRGVQIGNVEKILFVQNEYAGAGPIPERYILIRMALDARMTLFKGAGLLETQLNQEVARGLRVRLASQGLTGAAYLEADYFDPVRNPPLKISWTPKSLYIPSAPSTITRIGQAADEVFQRIQRTDVESVVKHLDEFLMALTKTVEDMKPAELSAEARGLLKEARLSTARVRELLASPEISSIPADASAAAAAARRVAEATQDDWPPILANLRETTDRLTTSTRTVEAMLRGGEIRQSIDAIARAAHNADTASEGLPEAAERLNASLRRIEDMLARQQSNIEAVIGNLKDISENLRDLSGDARRYPSRVLFGDEPKALEP